MKSTLYIIFILLNVSNCSSSKDFSNLKFGEGGGFTGAVTEYQINSNGDTFINKSFEKEHSKLKTLTQSDLKHIQKKIDKLSKETLAFSYPGNIYYFIETEEGNKKKKITWGDPNFPAPAEIKDLYNELQKLIKQ